MGVFGLAADAALGYLRQRGNFRFGASAERVLVSENDDLLNAFLSKTAYVQLDKDVNARRVRPRVDVYCSGFPCQPSSTMGKLLRHRDSRSQPQKGVEAYISGVKPTSFVLDNVCNIARGGGAAKWHSFVRRLEKCGYCVYQKDINSKHYGVLQSRPRRYVVGVRQEICHKTPLACPEPRIATCGLVSLLDAGVGRPWLRASQLPTCRTARRNMLHAEQVLSLEPMGAFAVADLRASNQRKWCKVGGSGCLTKSNCSVFGFWAVRKASREGLLWRRLSVTEMARLQGWPAHLTKLVSESLPARVHAAALGNGFTFTVMEAILIQLIPCLV